MPSSWPDINVIAARGWRFNARVNANYMDSFSALESAAGHLDSELNNPDSAFKHDRTTTVKRVTRGSRDWVIKRYNARNFWHRIKRALRQSRAQRCWKMSQHFRRAGLNVAEPVLMLERRFGPLTGNTYFVSRYLHGVTVLDALPSMSREEQALLLKAVNAAFADMDRHSLTHGDMKASNLLWVNQQLYFVDLDAACRHSMRTRWRHSHAKDRKRFLKNWRDRPELLALFQDLYETP